MDAVAHRTVILLLAGAGVAIYIASKAAVDAVIGRSLTTSGRLAMGHWLVIAAVALTAMVLGFGNVAVGLIFASSVVCLTLGVGSLVVVGKTAGLTTRRPAAAMLLPAALLAFLAGFHGRLTITQAAALALLGAMSLMLWRGPEGEATPTLAIARRGAALPRALQLLLAVGLACVGGWAAARGMAAVHPANGLATPALLTVTLLAPLTVLPMLGVGIDLAYRRRSAVAYDAIIGVVLLNLCLLLPACVVESYLPARAATSATPTTLPTTQPATDAAPPGLPLPRVSWRVDAVALVVLGMLFLPVSLGRWPLSRGDGIGLIVAYLLYVLVAIGLQIQSV